MSAIGANSRHLSSLQITVFTKYHWWSNRRNYIKFSQNLYSRRKIVCSVCYGSIIFIRVNISIVWWSLRGATAASIYYANELEYQSFHAASVIEYLPSTHNITDIILSAQRTDIVLCGRNNRPQYMSCLNVRPLLHPVRASNTKGIKHRKPKLMWTTPQNMSNWFAFIFVKI